MIFIPIFIQRGNNEYDKKKVLTFALTMVIILFVFIIFFVFPSLIGKVVSTPYFYIGCLIFGILTPTMVKKFINKKIK